MKVSRRRALITLGGLAGLAPACATQSGAGTSGPCPTIAGQRVTWIVPHNAGGGYDTESRLIAPRLAEHLGADIAVRNMSGAGGIVGARAIATAPPDGRTVGILGVSGLLISAVTGVADAPHPASAFTVLGRVSRSWHVWATGRSSALPTIEAVLERSRVRPILVAVSETTSVNFASMAASAALVGLEVEFVAGFDGARAASLAAVAGNVDLVCFNFETIRDLVEAGDLTPILLLGQPAGNLHQSLAGVPVLGGATGWAARRARERREPPETAQAAADALVKLIGTGRIVVAPAGLDSALATCLSDALHTVLTRASSATPSAAFDIATGPAAREEVVSSAAHVPLFLPAITSAMARLRRTP